MQVPPHVGDQDRGGGALEFAPGAPEVAQAPLAPIAMPVIVPVIVPVVVPPIVVPPIAAPGVGAGGGPGAGAGTPRGPATNSGPRSVGTDPRTGRQPDAPARGGPAGPAATYRVGYVEYLRTAGMSQIAAVAVPGVAGILALTCAGGFVGYRQAKAGRAVRTAGTARFIE